MESSIPLHCKLSPSTDTTMLMACSAALEPHFQVDDLLNFSNDEDDDADSTLRSPLIPHATAAGLLFAPPLSVASLQMNKEEASLLEEPSHGLCVPPDELVHQLEWLSSFNEDNFFSGGGDAKLLSPTTSSSQASSGLTQCKDTPIMTQRARDDFRSESPVSVLEHGGHAYALNHHVHRASRIRKARTGGRVWSLDILKPILFDNRLKASYDSSSLLVTSCSSAYSEPLCSFLQPDDSERPYKKMKQVSTHDAISDSVLVRKCTHCSVQKTPQWRAGPLGPKTLCNACGVRYKSGRLVPEYRPAASPSFINEVHSNSHRRILEMRRVKEVESSVKHHKSKAERAYKKDSKPESCRVLRISDEGTAKGMQNANETLLSDGVSGCEEGVRRGDSICGEGVSGKEDSIDGCFASCEADIVSNAACVHKAPNSTSACKEEHMEESVHMEAVCEQDSFCGKGATAVMFELDTHQGHKVEARAQIDQDKNAAA